MRGLESVGEVGEAARPNLLAGWPAAAAELAGRRLAVFLDYDGTLTPIVARPEEARLDEATREALRRLAAVWPTTIVSGRARDDVAERVGLADLGYAGSHGFDISVPGASRARMRVGAGLIPLVREAAEELRRRTRDIPGVLVEEKVLSVALHHRLVAEADLPAVESAFRETLVSHSWLRPSAGKKVLELRPALEWDKGRAILWLLERSGPDADRVVPIYVGDDRTDEDAFEALRGRGLTVRVTETPRPTAARYSLRDPEEVRELLGRLAALRCPGA